MRFVLTKLTKDEIKQISEAATKFKGDANKENYQKVITSVLRQACIRIKRDVGEVDLLDDGTIVLKYERMSEHQLRIAILMELEMVRNAVSFQAQVLEKQIQMIKTASEPKEGENPPDVKTEEVKPDAQV